MIDIVKSTFLQYRDQVNAFLLAVAELSDDALRCGIIDRYRAKNKVVPPHFFQASNGIFTNHVFKTLVYFRVWESLGGNNALNEILLEHIIRKLSENLLIYSFTDSFFRLNNNLIILHNSENLPFYVLGLTHVIEVMSDAVVAIDVKDGNGDLNRGSGVVFHTGQEGVGLLLTNKHVIENKAIYDINTENGIIGEFSKPILHPTADLAKIRVEIPLGTPKVNLAIRGNILDKIVSMGHPRIPSASSHSVMCHQGEINGHITGFDGNGYIAISCHVSPGNSGGPLFNEHGFCVGLVTQSGFAKYNNNYHGLESPPVTYHMAIPVDVIRDFIGT
jgi:S1-C subfamily serine protease